MDTSLGMFLAWLALGLFDVAGVGFMMVGKFLGIATLTDIGWLLKAGGSKSSRHDAACGVRRAWDSVACTGRTSAGGLV